MWCALDCPPSECARMHSHPRHWSEQLEELTRGWLRSNPGLAVYDAAEVAVALGLVDERFIGYHLHQIANALAAHQHELREDDLEDDDHHMVVLDDTPVGAVVSYSVDGERGEPSCPSCQRVAAGAVCDCGAVFRRPLEDELHDAIEAIAAE